MGLSSLKKKAVTSSHFTAYALLLEAVSCTVQTSLTENRCTQILLETKALTNHTPLRPDIFK